MPHLLKRFCDVFVQYEKNLSTLNCHPTPRIALFAGPLVCWFVGHVFTPSNKHHRLMCECVNGMEVDKVTDKVTNKVANEVATRWQTRWPTRWLTGW